MKLEDLKPNPGNPRKISDAKLAMLTKALAEFGDLSGIVFNRRTGHLVGGHQRLKALPRGAEFHVEQRSVTSPTGTVAEGEIVIEGESYRYREVDWDEQKELAANIAANKHGGDWDLPKLTEWLLALDANNYTLDLTGFSETEIAGIVAPIGTNPDEHWTGMPEFTQEDQMAYRTIKVHFAGDEAVKLFSKLLAQTITDKTKFVWFPKAEKEKVADKAYGAEA